LSRTPLVSVIIPMYNVEKVIGLTLESIQKQTYSNLEIICANDGSDDATLSIVERRAKLDKRIKPYSHEHRGIVYALNKAIKLSQGKYLARMDADDIAFLDRIEKQVRYMESNPDIIASGGALVEFDESGVLKIVARRPLDHAVMLFYQLRNIPIWNPTSIIRRRVLMENNISTDENFPLIEDYKFFFDLSRVGRLGNLPDILHAYRRHTTQTSTKYGEQRAKLAFEFKADIYKFLCEKYALNPVRDKPREWRRKIPRDHDAIWPFLWHTITRNEDLAKLKKLRLVLFTHLRLTAKPRLIYYIFFRKGYSGHLKASGERG